jgi:hypothetical protein
MSLDNLFKAMEYAKHRYMNQKLRIEYIVSFKINGMYHAKYNNMSVLTINGWQSCSFSSSSLA